MLDILATNLPEGNRRNFCSIEHLRGLHVTAVVELAQEPPFQQVLHRIARLFRSYLRGKRAGQNPVVAVPLRICREFTNYRVVPLAEVGLLARGDVREFNLLADLQNLLPGLVALVHLLRLVVLHQRLEVFLLQGLEIHRLRNLLDRFRREVEPPANHVQAVRGTAEPRLRRKETVRKHGAHFLLLFEIVLHELAEVIVVKKMFQRDTHAHKLHYFYTKMQFLSKKACKTRLNR